MSLLCVCCRKAAFESEANCELRTANCELRPAACGLHFLEIPKYTKSPKKRIRDMTKMERWLAYFANQLIRL